MAKPVASRQFFEGGEDLTADPAAAKMRIHIDCHEFGVLRVDRTEPGDCARLKPKASAVLLFRAL